MKTKEEIRQDLRELYDRLEDEVGLFVRRTCGPQYKVYNLNANGFHVALPDPETGEPRPETGFHFFVDTTVIGHKNIGAFISANPAFEVNPFGLLYNKHIAFVRALRHIDEIKPEMLYYNSQYVLLCEEINKA